MADDLSEMLSELGRVHGSGLRHLMEGEVNTPGIVSLIVIIAVVIFMYWAIRYK